MKKMHFLTDLQKILITLRAIFKSVNVVVLYDIDMMTNKQAFDLSLKCPFTMLVSGPSGCGKLTFVRELIAVSYTHLTLPTTPYV